MKLPAAIVLLIFILACHRNNNKAESESENKFP